MINICLVAAGFDYLASMHRLIGLSMNIAFVFIDKGIYSIVISLGAIDRNINDVTIKDVDEKVQ